MFISNNKLFSIPHLLTLSIIMFSLQLNAKLVKYNFENNQLAKKHYIITDKNQDFIIYENDKYININDVMTPIHLYSIDKKLKKGKYYFVKNVSILFPSEHTVKFDLMNTLSTYIIDNLGYVDMNSIGIDKVMLIIKRNLEIILTELKISEEDFVMRTNLSTYYINNEIRVKLVPIILKVQEDIAHFKTDIETFEKNKGSMDNLIPLNIKLYKRR